MRLSNVVHPPEGIATQRLGAAERKDGAEACQDIGTAVPIAHPSDRTRWHNMFSVIIEGML